MSFDLRTLRPRRTLTLGDFGVESLIPLASAAITAGAGLGSTFIVTSAQKDVAKQNAATELQIALKQEETNLAIARLGVQQTGQAAAVASQAVSTGGLVLALAILAGLVFGGR